MILRNPMVKSNRIEVSLFRRLVVPSLRTESRERGRQRIGNQPEGRWTTRRVSKNGNLSRPACYGGVGCSQRRWRTPHVGFLLWREQESSRAKWIGNIY